VVKWQRHEADHSLPSGAEVKNGGAIRSLPDTSSWHYAQLIKHRDFTFLLSHQNLTDEIKVYILLYPSISRILRFAEQ
jgi:hypothetical protein